MKELTPHQREICRLVIQGLSNREVGEKLFIEECSVKAQLTKIYIKLGIKTRWQLIAKGIT